MDESFQELEAELKALKPRHPSPTLVERLATELPAPRPRYTTATNLRSWKWLGWPAAGLAAAAALIAVAAVLTVKRAPAAAGTAPVAQAALTPAPATQAAIDRYQPVAAANVLYDLKDEGLVRTEDDSSARRVRYRYLDTYTWKNPRSNASLKWSVPRDEIRLVSATLN